MIRTPALRTSDAPMTPMTDNFYDCYTRVYSACAGYGMRPEACAQYAEHAVSSMAELGLKLSEAEPK